MYMLLFVISKCFICTISFQEKYWSDDHPDGILVPKYQCPTIVYLQNGAAKYLVMYTCNNLDLAHHMCVCTMKGDVSRKLHNGDTGP